jgi:CRISPR/Cas system-associated endonuclease Cas1
MHEGRDGSSKFIFDLMEPERPRVDRAVLDFVKGQVFDAADFIIRTDGVCRLNPEMARMVVARVSAQKIFDAAQLESVESECGAAAVRSSISVCPFRLAVP